MYFMKNLVINQKVKGSTRDFSWGALDCGRLTRSVLLALDVLGNLGEHLREHPAGHGFFVLEREVEGAEETVEATLLMPPHCHVVGLPLPVGDVGAAEEHTACVARPRIVALELGRTELGKLAFVRQATKGLAVTSEQRGRRLRFHRIHLPQGSVFHLDIVSKLKSIIARLELSVKKRRLAASWKKSV